MRNKQQKYEHLPLDVSDDAKRETYSRRDGLSPLLRAYEIPEVYGVVVSVAPLT